MSLLITLGAINKNTGEYVSPKTANKNDEYICIDCKKDLIICKGDIRTHHFRHYTETIKCNYYNSPNETQIHKDAKMLMKMLLDKKVPITFIRSYKCCNKTDEFEIPEITETSTIEIEYRFDYNNGIKIADVAYIDNGELICIFEICNTHKTCNNNRPEPWFEIDAETLISISNDICVRIPCIRNCKCEDCNENERVAHEKAKITIYNKNKAVDIVYDWLKDGYLIDPFKPTNEDFVFGKIEKYVKRDCKNEMWDLVIYENWREKDENEDYFFDRYYIKLVYEHEYANFTKEEIDIAEDGCSRGINYIDIKWVLSQTIKPTRINCIAEVCEYTDSIYCIKCNADTPFYVKRTYKDYKVINGGCLECKYNANTEFADCFRCGENDLICVMETNVIKSICKSCDIYLYDKVLLQVPYSEKDAVKKYGAWFDTLSKKWWVKNNNKDIDSILSKWKKTVPDHYYLKSHHPY